MPETTTTAGRKKIVILGAGFAGAYCALELGKRLRDSDDADVLLIDKHNYFIFYPLLVEAGTGELEAKHAVVAIRNFVRKGRVRFVMASVDHVDLAKQEVRYCAEPCSESRTELTVRYDHLVVALGAVANLPPVPGLRRYAYGMKSLTEALALRDRAVQLLEEAEASGDREKARRLLHFVVVGGNYTGVEVAGESDAYLKDAARRYPNLNPDDVKVTLVDRNDRILNTLDEDLAKWAARHLTRRGLELRLKDTVTEIGPDYCVFGDGTRAGCHTVIWCAGIAPPPVLKRIGVPTDSRGWMLCAPDFRVNGMDNVWGCGDAAVNPDGEGGSFPPTAQHAVQEGVQCARNVLRALRKEPLKVGKIRNKGSLAAFGRHDAVAKVFGLRLTGFPAWFLWRTVYLFKMPGLGRKVRVALDWTFDLFFPAEHVELGIDRTVRHLAEHAAAQTPAGAARPTTSTPRVPEAKTTPEEAQLPHPDSNNGNPAPKPSPTAVARS